MPENSENLPLAIQRKIAVSLHRAGNASEAADLYRTLLEKTPNDIELLYLAGTAELQCERPDEAVMLFGALLARQSDHVKALVNRGVAFMALSERANALADFTKAVALDPADIDARYNRGSVLLSFGQTHAALAEFDAVLAACPHHLGAANNRGNALRSLHRTEEALAAYDAVTALAPDHLHAHYNRAVVLCELNRPEEALSACDAVLTHAPDYAEAHCCRGNALRELGRYDEALAAYDTAQTLKPDYADAVWDRSLVELLLGDYDAGWTHYEARWRSALPRSGIWFSGPKLWAGEPLDGKTILLHAEQGLGDTLQFSRYVPLIARLGGTVRFRAPKALLPLLSTLAGDFTLLEENAKTDYDYHCPLMSLPALLGTRVDTIPASVPYLTADPTRCRRWAEKLGPKTVPRIGLVWSGRAGLAPDRTRSATLAHLAPLLALPFAFHCLQQEIRPADAAVLPRFANLHTHTDELGDFADTAALIAQMDVTVSVDTSVAHAAGALGAPVWLMLPFTPDWRWFLHRADSPWYPTARLFRQRMRNDWDGVAADIAAALTLRFS